ncbi:MAG: GNAT family N-acetyltransferase [Verrucomicrobiae bacterium]|nr:GNAT family N-acetyltransferase [Verrucomicrobiae bacterium]
MTTRKFKKSDAPEVSRIMIAAFKTFLGRKWNWIDEKHFSPKTLAAASNTQSELDEAASFVAVEGKTVLGYIRGTASACGLGSLEVVGVDPATLHKGVGKALMKALEDFWRQKKQRKVHTCVCAHNSRALIYYLSNGFIPAGYRKDHFKPGVDEIILDRFF